jgi:hypothetical protein
MAKVYLDSVRKYKEYINRSFYYLGELSAFIFQDLDGCADSEVHIKTVGGYEISFTIQIGTSENSECFGHEIQWIGDKIHLTFGDFSEKHDFKICFDNDPGRTYYALLTNDFELNNTRAEA